MKYRVLMQDTVNGKAFNFALLFDDVENKRQVSYETQAQLGWTDSQVHSHSACVLALGEFPDATVVDSKKVAPTVKEMLKDALTKLYSKAA